MKKQTESRQAPSQNNSDYFERLIDDGWTYIKTVVDVVREPILILDKNLRITNANQSFYEVFKVEQKDTEGKIIYELGNGQWDIPELRKLLEDILPKKTFFKGFEVTKDFPIIGKKVMILNARQIHLTKTIREKVFPQIILLAIEDITDMVMVAENLATHARQLETRLSERTKKLEVDVEKLEKQVKELKNE